MDPVNEVKERLNFHGIDATITMKDEVNYDGDYITVLEIIVSDIPTAMEVWDNLEDIMNRHKDLYFRVLPFPR